MQGPSLSCLTLSSSPATPSSLLLSAPERVCWGVGWEVEGASGRFWGLLVGSLLEEAASVSMDEESVSEDDNELVGVSGVAYIFLH